MASPSNRSRASRMVTKFPKDFDIFSSPSPTLRTAAQCIQVCEYSFPLAASLCAISFSWCGNIRSGPPPWMSSVSPRCFLAMALHSMCQPGRPRPQGDAQEGSFSFAVFHSAKSSGASLPSPTPTRAPAWLPSRLHFESRPYSVKLRTRKYTSSPPGSPELPVYACRLSSNLDTISMISGMHSDTRGSTVGGWQPRLAASRCISSSMRRASASAVSPFSRLLLMILSSMSVTFRTNLTV
mmetsp:Transcript_104569/g.320324  ORF Transcript_104569/g.320324 Transcript_104569/m.320324 type:complete len:239 (-) Transcript_104569:1006-1722(-)